MITFMATVRDAWAAALMMRTGPFKFLVRVDGMAVSKGFRFTLDGLFATTPHAMAIVRAYPGTYKIARRHSSAGGGGDTLPYLVPLHDERELLGLLNMKYKSPEERY